MYKSLHSRQEQGTVDGIHICSSVIKRLACRGRLILPLLKVELLAHCWLGIAFVIASAARDAVD